jgi:hypothetical protein
LSIAQLLALRRPFPAGVKSIRPAHRNAAQKLQGNENIVHAEGCETIDQLV